MCSATGTSGGYEVIHAAGEIAEQDVELHEANGILLICQARWSVAGIGAVR